MILSRDSSEVTENLANSPSLFRKHVLSSTYVPDTMFSAKEKWMN